MEERVCRNCKYHQFERDPETADTFGIAFDGTLEEKKKFLRTIWYNHFCTHQESIYSENDPVTGEISVKFKHCHDVNKDGNCPLFVKKS